MYCLCPLLQGCTLYVSLISPLPQTCYNNTSWLSVITSIVRLDQLLRHFSYTFFVHNRKWKTAENKTKSKTDLHSSVIAQSKHHIILISRYSWSIAISMSLTTIAVHSRDDRCDPQNNITQKLASISQTMMG